MRKLYYSHKGLCYVYPCSEYPEWNNDGSEVLLFPQICWLVKEYAPEGRICCIGDIDVSYLQDRFLFTPKSHLIPEGDMGSGHADWVVVQDRIVLVFEMTRVDASAHNGKGSALKKIIGSLARNGNLDIESIKVAVEDEEFTVFNLAKSLYEGAIKKAGKIGGYDRALEDYFRHSQQWDALVDVKKPREHWLVVEDNSLDTGLDYLGKMLAFLLEAIPGLDGIIFLLNSEPWKMVQHPGQMLIVRNDAQAIATLQDKGIELVEEERQLKGDEEQ